MKKILLALAMVSASSASAAVLENGAQQKPEGSAHENMHLAMTSMCENMSAMKMTGSIDHDFLLMMIPHHQSALEMAQAYLKEAHAPEIRETAEKIIAAQQKEIEEMQLWLKQHPVSTQR